jgi:unsaturated pyranuronate lyase
MPFVDSGALPVTERLPGWRARVFHSPAMTFAWYEIEYGAVPLHEHHHPQEEVWNVVEGRLAMTVDGEERVLDAGGSAVIPAGVRHSARPLGACRAVVVDHPARPEAGRGGGAARGASRGAALRQSKVI